MIEVRITFRPSEGKRFAVKLFANGTNVISGLPWDQIADVEDCFVVHGRASLECPVNLVDLVSVTPSLCQPICS